MELKEKIKICKIVAGAILADGQVTDAEHEFINTLMKKYNLTSEEQKEVLARNLDDDPAEIVKGIDSFESKNELIVELVMAVAADNELAPSERALINKVADSIGVSMADMDILIKTALM